ncbi:hypothetical protein N7481_006173 [Penicillium waksmanii]|uniref:uncharacterized protein n=1 Tax=Penicillium waksmanii TaxID=69791 RepID=UPI002548CB8A|nr:uncharacterized protein N7481_006173 [Penicillium waksmanii]KAJ5984074.1 hypothetical protein N7481_006173 [Penicillium waksmanii]
MVAAATIAFGLWFLTMRFQDFGARWKQAVEIISHDDVIESNYAQPSTAASETSSEKEAKPSNVYMSSDDVERYVGSILEFGNDVAINRTVCPSEISYRYSQLSSMHGGNGKIKYFFALDLYQSAGIISRLMSSIVETMRFLGPENCAISVVEGRSEDGTYEILAALKERIDAMGGHFFLSSSDINPKAGKDVDRVQALAKLRNMALLPLKSVTSSGSSDKLGEMYSSDAVIIFVNDIVVCPEDILELVFQHANQEAHMTCAFDWIFNGTTFYDVWVSRTLVGDTFFEIPHDGSWSYSKDLFWSDPDGRRRYEAKKPFQVYSCWGGMVTLDAASFADDTVKFRASDPGECYMGEPTLLAKDLYRQGLGKVLAVPAVNVAYSDEEAVGTRALRGYVGDHIDQSRPSLARDETVQWQSAPPAMVKCLPNFNQPSWTSPV